MTGGPRTLGPPDKNDHKKFDSTFLGFLEKCFNFGGKYHISGKFLGVSGRGGGEVAEVEQRGAKSGRLTEGPQQLRYATGYRR